jgi:predicted nucleic acid-binding protein
LTYLLDTNAVIAILRDQPLQVRRRLRRALARDATIAVSSVVLYELWHGVMRSQRRAENAERLRAFLAGNIAVVPFDEADAAAAGELRAPGSSGPDHRSLRSADRRAGADSQGNAGDCQRSRIRQDFRIVLAKLGRSRAQGAILNRRQHGRTAIHRPFTQPSTPNVSVIGGVSHAH